ncbi:MAG: ClpXP protease specificity-enhancing factor SspB [Gammaproteobacteria bacterium]|nr:ClpXP protease specificity-enhancing factor SspB [Gammaproteobacteria bacterium]
MMNSVVPYLIRAYCEWMEDSNLTPHILVNCEAPGVVVPEGLSKEGKIVLNLSSTATVDRLMTNESISFRARFGGQSQEIFVPCGAVLTIYAQENGEGMFFDSKTEDAPAEDEKPNLTLLD